MRTGKEVYTSHWGCECGRPNPMSAKKCEACGKIEPPVVPCKMPDPPRTTPDPYIVGLTLQVLSWMYANSQFSQSKATIVLGIRLVESEEGLDKALEAGTLDEFRNCFSWLTREGYLFKRECETRVEITRRGTYYMARHT